MLFWKDLPRPHFSLISLFANDNLRKNTVRFSGIRTWIVGVDDKHTDN